MRVTTVCTHTFMSNQQPLNVTQALERQEQSWRRTSKRLDTFWTIIVYVIIVQGIVSVYSRTPELLTGWGLVRLVVLVTTYCTLFHVLLLRYNGNQRWAVVYLVMQTIIATSLIIFYRSFIGLGFAVLAQLIGLLPPRRWPIPIIMVVAVLGYSWGIHAGIQQGNWSVLGDFLVSIMLYLGLFIGLETITLQRQQLKQLVDDVQHAHAQAQYYAAQNAELATARQRTIEQLETTRRDLVAAERAAGVLAERQRMAHEIHDTLAQGFTSIVMHLEAAEQQLPDTLQRVQQHLDQARRTARDSLAEARRLVWALRPQALEQTALPEALTRLVADWSQTSGVAAEVNVTGTPRSLAPQIESTLLRVAQEALANTRKYAHARQVMFTLSFMDDQVIMDVQDDGIGFETERNVPVSQNGGYGLVAMRERLAQIDGTLLIESAPGEGTTVVAEVKA